MTLGRVADPLEEKVPTASPRTSRASEPCGQDEVEPAAWSTKRRPPTTFRLPAALSVLIGMENSGFTSREFHTGEWIAGSYYLRYQATHVGRCGAMVDGMKVSQIFAELPSGIIASSAFE